MSKNSVKPLELVISAIHSLKDVKGSTPQNILRYLVQKYSVDARLIKPYVQTGLVKGLNFGLITEESGTYRLNDVLSIPLDLSVNDNKRQYPKLSKLNKRIRKRRQTKLKISGRRKRKRFKTAACISTKRKPKNRKEKKRRRTGLRIRRGQNESKRRKQQKLKMKVKRKSKKKRKQKNVNVKVKKITPDVHEPNSNDKTEGDDATKPSAKT